MKSCYFLLVSALVLGYACVKAFPQEIEQTSIDSSTVPDGNGNFATTPNNNLFDEQSPSSGDDDTFVLNEETGVNTTPISLLDTASEIHEYLVNKLREIYRMLKGRKNKTDLEQATRLDFEHLPEFTDPLYIGSFSKSYKLADVTFSNLQVEGLGGFRKSEVHVDQKERRADLHLFARYLKITGKYLLKNYFKTASGPFIVKLVDNVTYHESSVYCRLNREVDVATSECGIHYGKSENDYKNLGFFTQLFRGAISNPLINEVIQKVGKELGHKMRPLLLSKLRETVMGKDNTENSAMVPGLETLIRGSVSEVRNLMIKDDYKNFQLEGNTESEQYGIYDVGIQNIFLSGINTFETTSLKIPVENEKIIVDLTARTANMNGSANIMFWAKKVMDSRSENSENVVLPFDIENLNIQITLDKLLSDDFEKFQITKLDVTMTKLVTNPRGSYDSQIDTTLRDSLPEKLKSTIIERFSALVKSNIENILRESSVEKTSS